jgi:hypothetical protein
VRQNKAKSIFSSRPGKLSVACFLIGVGVIISGAVWVISSYDDGSSQGGVLIYVGSAIVVLGAPLARLHHREIDSRGDENSGVDS